MTVILCLTVSKITGSFLHQSLTSHLALAIYDFEFCLILV